MFAWTIFVSLVVGFGATLIVLFACMFELVRCSGLANQSIVMKRVFKLLGIKVIELSEEERMGVVEKLDYQVKEFAEKWVAGESNVVHIPLYQLDMWGEAIGFEQEIEKLRKELVRLPIVEDIEVCEDRYNLIVTIDESVLIACYETQLDEWIEQGQLERAEYYRSRGVI